MMMDTPALRLLLDTFPSIVKQETQTGDGLNGYGTTRTYWAQVVVLCEECVLCRELSLTETYIPGRGCKGGPDQHKWRKVQHVIATINGKTMDEALSDADIETADFLRLVATRTPEFAKMVRAYLD